jgi:hypothetical protein
MRATFISAAVTLAAISFQLQSSRPVLADDNVVPLTIRKGPVNNPAADTTSWNTQAGPQLLDLGGSKLFVAWYDSGSYNPATPLKKHFTGYAYSSDNGVTWTDRGRLPNFLPSNQAEGDGLFTGPALAARRATHTVYLATTNQNSPQDILVFKSTDYGHTFSAPVSATPGDPGGFDIRYKPDIAVDNFAGLGSGNVYVCFSHYPVGGGNSEVRLSRSIDAGATFTPNLGTLIGPGSAGCSVVVSPNHQVGVFYLKGTGPSGEGGDNRLLMRRSTNRGLTFGPAIQVADLKSTTIWGDLHLSAGVQSNSFPQVVVNPVTAKPYIFVFFNDDRVAGDADHSDIYYTESKDNGQTWSAPVRVNDDVPGDQFYPSAAFVDAGSNFAVSYFSCSHDRDNHFCHRRAREAVIGPNGVVIDPSFQLGSDTPFGYTDDPFFFNPGNTWLGDSEGAAGGPGAVSFVWSDNRARDGGGNPDTNVYFSRFLFLPPSTNLSLVASASPATMKLGAKSILNLAASAMGGPANDVLVHLSPTPGLAYLNATPPAGGSCTNIGQFVDCSLGAIATGAAKSITVGVAAVYAAGTRTVTAAATTSSKETAPANNTDSAAFKSTPVTTVTHPFTASDLPVTIPPGGVKFINIPVNIASGKVNRVAALVRLDHPQDREIKLVLTRTANMFGTDLSIYNGGAHANYGSGPNDCTGTKTTFDDGANRSILGGVAPFAGTYRPQSPLGKLEYGAVNTTWILGIQNHSASDDAVLGCFQLRITYEPS